MALTNKNISYKRFVFFGKFKLAGGRWGGGRGIRADWFWDFLGIQRDLLGSGPAGGCVEPNGLSHEGMGEKPLEMTYGTAGWFVGSLFGKLLAILKDGPPIFGGLRKWIGSRTLRTFLGMLAEWHSRTPPYASLKNRKLVVMVVMNVMSESRGKKLQKQLGRDSNLLQWFEGQVWRTHFRHLKSDEVMCFWRSTLAAMNLAAPLMKSVWRCLNSRVERLHRCAAAWQLCHLSTVWAPRKMRPLNISTKPQGDSKWPFYPLVWRLFKPLKG